MTTHENTKLSPLQQMAVSRKLIEAEIIAHAWADEGFRTKLKTDPAAALTEAGLPLPKNTILKVVAEEPNTITLVLPPLPEQTEEADDGELEAVAGGGILENGKCRGYDYARQAKEKGDIVNTVAGYTHAILWGAIGISWGWGWNQ